MRDWQGQNPIRIVLDKNGRISQSHHIKDNSVKTIIITEQENLTATENCIYENAIFDSKLTKSIISILHKYGIQSVIIEGGRQTLQTFIDDDLWDEARVFKGNIYLKEGIKAPVLNGNSELKSVKGDQLKLFFNHD